MIIIVYMVRLVRGQWLCGNDKGNKIWFTTDQGEAVGSLNSAAVWEHLKQGGKTGLQLGNRLLNEKRSCQFKNFNLENVEVIQPTSLVSEHLPFLFLRFEFSISVPSEAERVFGFGFLAVSSESKHVK